MIVFDNEGSLDLRAITTFGVSSKEKDGAIGFFGTGLKYAIAVLLREDCSIEIFTDRKRLTFRTEKESIRVNEFETVHMVVEENDPGADLLTRREYVRLGFTTELGKTWELWQAYRELWSNCIDEGGTVDRFEPEEFDHWTQNAGTTTIVVRGARFERVHENRFGEVLCPPNSVIYDDGHICEVKAGATNRLYYRGIRALELNRHALYTYNIRMPMELTEDRTIKYQFRAMIAVGSAVAHTEDRAFLERILLADNQTFEGSIDFEMCPGVAEGPIFRDVVREVSSRHPSKINRSAMGAAKISVYDALPKETDVGVLRGVNSQRLEKAIAFCKDIGFEVDEFPIVVVGHIDNGLLGLAHEGRIFLSRLAFEQGTKIVAGTLIEEYLHLSRNVEDCTREMQNMLVDTIVSLGEELKGEPL